MFREADSFYVTAKGKSITFEEFKRRQPLSFEAGRINRLFERRLTGYSVINSRLPQHDVIVYLIEEFYKKNSSRFQFNDEEKELLPRYFADLYPNIFDYEEVEADASQPLGWLINEEAREIQELLIDTTYLFVERIKRRYVVFLGLDSLYGDGTFSKKLKQKILYAM